VPGRYGSLDSDGGADFLAASELRLAGLAEVRSAGLCAQIEGTPRGAHPRTSLGSGGSAWSQRAAGWPGWPRCDQ